MKPLVSVVMATYNNAEFLSDAIESVLSQSYNNIELIIVNDGSTDNTKFILEYYENLSNVHIYHQENQGQTISKNKGIKATSGEYIAFCDSDDKWAHDKLEKQIPCFSKDENIGVVYSHQAIIGKENEIANTDYLVALSGDILKELFIFNFIPFGTAVVRRDCFDKVGTFDESFKMGIDWDLWLRIAVQYKFYHLDEITYFYRVWGGQMSNNYLGRYYFALKIMRQFVKNHPDAIPNSVKRNAWANTYVNRGRAIFLNEGKLFSPLKDYLKALSYNFLYMPAWKSILKIPLGR